MKFRIREGNSGILYINEGENNCFKYIPNYDLDKAFEREYEFLNIIDSEKIKLKDNYYNKNINWFPSQYTYLFWNIFFPLVKYLDFIEKYVFNSEIQFEFINQNTFYLIYNIITGNDNLKKFNIKKWLYNKIIYYSNRKIINTYKPELLFFCFSPNDFRGRDINAVLDELKVNYVKVIYSSGELWRKALFHKYPYYLIGINPRNNLFRKNYCFENFSNNEQLIYKNIITYMELQISSFIEEVPIHEKIFKKHQPKVLYGFDEAHHIMPLIYTVKKFGIKSIAHQHGAYVKRHYGYSWKGLERSEITWWDKIIVWGDYWKNQLKECSNIYLESDLIIGCNKNYMKFFTLENLNNPSPKNILVPYEFLTNTYRVGMFIKKLIDIGYNVYFKPRSDEKLDDQLEAYDIAEYKDRIFIADNMDEELIRKIDIVAGTMTSLIYELLPYNKIIWYFETEYKHLYDLVEQGYAHLIKYDNLDKLGPEYFKRCKININDMFAQNQLKEVIREYVIN
ncbi:MAG: hypothetical protein ACYDA4_11365 [Ignavibacteriaceae bacterium]